MTTNIRRRRRPVGGTSIDAFAPLGVSGLVGWWDFSDASTLYTDAGTTLVSADGDAIYQANDKSGNAKHAVQATAGSRPTYKLGIQNGRSVGRFDGNDFLDSSSGALAQPTTMFFVGKTTDVTFHNTFIGSSTNDVSFLLLLTSGYTWVYAGVGFGGTTGFVNTFLTGSTVVNGATSQIWIDGVSQATGNAGADTFANVRIGSNFAAPAGFDVIGDIAEVIIFNSALSAANHNTIGNYLAYKYGLSWTTVA